MSRRAVFKTIGIGVFSAGFGLLSAIYIVWFFGMAEFAIFTIASAVLSIVLLGLELVPGNYSVFKMQNDERFSEALATFYMIVGAVSVLATALLLKVSLVESGSWLIVPYSFLSVTQRYIELKILASGVVGAFARLPAIINLVRFLALVILGLPMLRGQPADVIWGSLCVGSALGQMHVLHRFPTLQQDLIRLGPFKSIRVLLQERSQYYPYMLNSVLKRLRDTFLPLFCDMAIPLKAEVGRLLLFTRANEAVTGQVRILEAFMINRAIRENLRYARRRIFWTIAPAGHVATVAIALVLMYAHGVGKSDVLLAVLTGFFIYPYVLELFWRNDALSSFNPRQVTISLLAFLAGLTFPPLIAFAVGTLTFPIIIGSYVLAQSLAAITYRIFPRVPDPASDRSEV